MKWAQVAIIVICVSCPVMVNAMTLKVKVEGIDGAELENVLTLLEINSEKDRDDLYLARVKKLHTAAPEQIQRALQPFGYYRVKVTSELAVNETAWLARYRVERGPPLRITTLDVQITGPGQQDKAFVTSQRDFPLKTGQILNHTQYEDAKQKLLRLAAVNGYLDAGFSRHQVEVDLETYTASVFLHFNSGPQYQFGAISFKQDPYAFKEKLLRRYIVVNPGDPFNSRALLRLQNTLTDSGYFTRVAVQPLKEQTSGQQIPVEILLIPKKKYRYRLGLGYGTDSGPRASLEHSQRVNSRGHKGIFNLRFSERINTGELQYIIPLKNPSYEQLAFIGSVIEEETESRDSRIFEIGARRTTRRGKWQETVGVNYEREDFEIATETDASVLVYPAVSWNRSETDDRLFPTRGWRLGVNLLASHETLGSDTDFLQGRVAGKWLKNIDANNRLIVRGEVGATLASSVEDLPASKRFFAGGDLSVRGYDFEELGPEDASGEVIGGKYLITGSLEYERRLFGKWSVAVFYDVGNALNSFDDDLKHGAGIGIRWHSPVGPIRLDVASPIDDPDDAYRLHLVIGPDL